MTTHQQLLDFYAHLSPLTAAGRHSALFAALPPDVLALVRIIQGFAEVCRFYEKDDRLWVPGTVFNAVLNRAESL